MGRNGAAERPITTRRLRGSPWLSRASRKKMTPEERLWLSPLEKWRRFRRFPWKCVLHLIIAVLTITQVLLLASKSSFYAGNLFVFRHSFLPDDVVSDDNLADRYIFTLHHLQTSLSSSVQKYYNFNETAPGTFSYYLTPDGHIEPPRMLWRNFTQGETAFVTNDFSVSETEILLTPGAPIGPLASPTLASDVRSVVSFDVSYRLISRELSTGPPISITWLCTVHYDLIGNGGRIGVILDLDSNVLIGSDYRVYHHPVRFWLSLVYLVLGLAALFLVIKAVHRSAKLFRLTRRALRRGDLSVTQSVRIERLLDDDDATASVPDLTLPVAPNSRPAPGSLHVEALSQHLNLHGPNIAASVLPDRVASPAPGSAHTHPHGHGAPATAAAAAPRAPPSLPPLPTEPDGHPTNVWASLKCRQKFRMFNSWHFVSILTNFVNVLTAMLFVTGAFTDANTIASRFLIGLNCALSCMLMVQYFKWNRKFYMLVTTLTTALPTVLRFIVNIAPVYLAYAFFGVAFFSACDPMFANIDNSLVTLFAILNGDEILDSFNAIYSCQPFLSRVYLYTFISLFIYSVLNIFIAIIEDAFLTARLAAEQASNAEHPSPDAEPDETTALQQSIADSLANTNDSQQITVRSAQELSTAVRQITQRALDDCESLVRAFVTRQAIAIEARGVPGVTASDLVPEPIPIPQPPPTEASRLADDDASPAVSLDRLGMHGVRLAARGYTSDPFGTSAPSRPPVTPPGTYGTTAPASSRRSVSFHAAASLPAARGTGSLLDEAMREQADGSDRRRGDDNDDTDDDDPFATVHRR